MKREEDTLIIGAALLLGGVFFYDFYRRRKIVAEAERYVGVPYVLGGSSTSSIDCSGLTMKAYQAVGINLPHKAAEQRQLGLEIPASAIEAGDIVYWDSGGGPHDHVGLYVGDGKVIHASSVYGKGVVDTLANWQKKGWLDGVRRIL